MLMEVSTTYQEILQKGRSMGKNQEALAMLIRLGTKRFGPPSASVLASIHEIANRGKLEELEERIFDAHDWEDLIGTAPSEK